VLENRVLRRILEPKRDKVRGDWRKLYNEELNDLYSSPSIIRVIKWRRMRWTGHVARMGKRSGMYRVFWGGDPGVNGRIILRWIFREVECGVWIGSSWLRIGTVDVHL